MEKESVFMKYLSINSAGGASWHPERNEVVYVYDGPGHFQLYSNEIKENCALWPKRRTYDFNRCTNPSYLPDGTIIYNRDEGGDENFQLVVINNDNDHIEITKDRKSKNLKGEMSSNYLYYNSNTRDKSVFDIYRHKIPVESNQSELIYQGKVGVPTIHCVNEEQKQALIQITHSNVKKELVLFNLETKEEKPLTKLISGDKECRWEPVRWIDSTHILVASDFESNRKRLVIITVNGEMKVIKEVEELEYEVQEAVSSNESIYTYFHLNVDGYSKLYRAVFDKDGLQVMQELLLPIDGVIASGDPRSFTKGMTLSKDNKYLALTLSASNEPLNVWVMNLETFVAWKATDAEVAGLNQKTFVKASLEDFSSFDDLRVPYFRLIPSGEKPQNGWPALLVIHGGPEAQTTPIFTPITQFFLFAGYAVIAPNIRGSAGYGRKYLDLDNKEKRLDSIMDIRHLALHIKENDKEIDGKKLIIYGGSYGGFAVLSAMTEHPDLWVAGIDIVGISNFVTFLENTAPWRRKLRESEYGSLEEDREMLMRISPIHKIDKIEAPLFIIHGDNDERVPLSEALQVYEKVKEKGYKAELLRFADEGHGITKLQNKIVAYSRIVEWLDEIIKEK